MHKWLVLIMLLQLPVYSRDVDTTFISRPAIRKVILTNLESIREQFFDMVKMSTEDPDLLLGIELLNLHLVNLFTKVRLDSPEIDLEGLIPQDNKIKNLQSQELRKKFINSFMILEKLKFLSLVKGKKSNEYEKTAFILKDSYSKIFEDLTEKSKLQKHVRICFQDFISVSYRISFEKDGFDILQSNITQLSQTIYDFVHTLSIMNDVDEGLITHSKNIRTQWNYVLKNVYKST